MRSLLDPQISFPAKVFRADVLLKALETLGLQNDVTSECILLMASSSYCNPLDPAAHTRYVFLEQ